MNTLTPSLEDYLEAIFVTSLTEKVARVKDIAKFLKVKTPSVIEALKTLSDKGLVVHEKYGYIELTKEGIKKAKEIYDKHKALSKFFHKILGVDSDTAVRDACQIEHHISKKTMNKLIKLIKFIETCPKEDFPWISRFHYFVKTGKHPEHKEK
ncbi:metal-dependent transcriptional regulator [candidate division WOR-3 bacterium]|nr:metal-dependent transcriptional regulator [candidate division WOR-3 bacterium]